MTQQNDKILTKLPATLQVVWLPPSQLDSDPDHDDENEHGFLDNLFVRISGLGDTIAEFQTSRRFTMITNKVSGDVAVYPDAEWGWDAHHELSPFQRSVIQRIADERPELLSCPAEIKSAILSLAQD